MVNRGVWPSVRFGRLVCLMAVVLLVACANAAIEPAAEGAVGSDGEPEPSSNANTLVSSRRCKRGMVIGNEVHPALSVADLQAVQGGVSWWYNYAFGPLSQQLTAVGPSLGIDFVPMAFTASSLNQSSIVIDGNARFLLAFNEPNFTEQANLTPQQAAAAWPALERLADSHNLLIVGPATNYCGGGCNETSPTAWLDAFFAACPNCRVDHLALHSYVCYASALNSAYLTPFERYKKPLWVTEFSCLDGSADASSLAVQQNAMIGEVAMLEANPNVYRYSWFIGRSNTASPPIGLLDANSQLTALGKLYVSLPQACDAP